MRTGLFLFSFFLMLLPLSGGAEELTLEGEILKDPVCFTVRNTAEHKVYGTFGTNYYVSPEGIKTRHRSNFRLEPAGTKDEQGYPADAAEFCSYGPFFEDRKLELTLRTLFPVFTCFTHVDQGEIVIHSKRKADDSGYDLSADCH